MPSGLIMLVGSDLRHFFKTEIVNKIYLNCNESGHYLFSAHLF